MSIISDFAGFDKVKGLKPYSMRYQSWKPGKCKLVWAQSWFNAREIFWKKYPNADGSLGIVTGAETSKIKIKLKARK